MAALSLQAAAQAQDASAVRPAQVEAAFLRNFARYVGWPARAFASDQSAWQVCILGIDHFDGALEITFRGRTEHGRPFEVLRVSSAEQLPACQIVYVDLARATERRAALATLKRRPVLTVGHADDFLDEGGIIRLVAGQRVEMSVNVDQARAAALTIPSTILELSREVVENGMLRRRR